jgi:hypothetical protein
MLIKANQITLRQGVVHTNGGSQDMPEQDRRDIKEGKEKKGKKRRERKEEKEEGKKRVKKEEKNQIRPNPRRIQPNHGLLPSAKV